MRYAVVASFVPLAVALLTAAPFDYVNRELSKADSPDVKVSLAVPEGYKTSSSPLHVIIENVGTKPQQHFEEWNSWGHGILSVEWADAAGNHGAVSKVPGGWDRNGPSTVAVEPGEALVREITFD